MSFADLYRVGWICAVHAERVAAEAFLDENFGVPPEVSRKDNNNYTLGVMGEHRVVIASLPSGEYGTASAASVARDMLHTFPNIRIGLMVGLGGGVPSRKQNIRLGDVVVSSPAGGTAGVFQYDFGESVQNEEFKETGHLDKPPPLLRAAVAGLAAKHDIHGNGIDQGVQSVLDKWPRLKNKYRRPNADLAPDQLFKSDVVHVGEGENCCERTPEENKQLLAPRKEREDDEDNPAVHYGLIASGNQLMKDAKKRDKIAAQKKVLCFEMEAAGLMNHFPCIVVRGICDYADSHKNYDWHGYASMTAAAYAKALLAQIPLDTIEAQQPVSIVVQQNNRVPDTIIGETEEINSDDNNQIHTRMTHLLTERDHSQDNTMLNFGQRDVQRDHEHTRR